MKGPTLHPLTSLSASLTRALAICAALAALALAALVLAVPTVANAHSTIVHPSRHTNTYRVTAARSHSHGRGHRHTPQSTGGTSAGNATETSRGGHPKHSAQHGTHAASTTDHPTDTHTKAGGDTRGKAGGNTHGKAAGEHPKSTHSKQTTPAPAPTPSAPAALPPPPTCTETGITPTPANLETVREATLCLINRERIAGGEQPLQLDDKLARCAQGHSEDMANQDYFSHQAPDGSTPLQRMQEVGYIYSQEIGYEVGENIAWGTLWLATPASIVESWMNSPEHRANILDANYRDTGIGVDPQAPAARAEGQPGALYTQDFGVIITG